MKKVVLSLVAVMLFAVASVQAQPIKLSLWGPICVPNEDITKGLEIAIGTKTETVKGLQFAFIYAESADLTGVQYSLVNNNTSKFVGAQLGFVNIAQDFKGIQWGGVNWTKGEFTGAQVGWVNYSNKVNGLQLGLVNVAENMHGVQIGFVNVITNSPRFLPFFVFFNFGF